MSLKTVRADVLVALGAQRQAEKSAASKNLAMAISGLSKIVRPAIIVR
jgi:hypothetical protein